MLILVALGKLYRIGRGLIPRQADVALQHGLAVVHLEQSWGIFVEWRVQALVLARQRWAWGPLGVDRHAVLVLINALYLDGHFLGTLLFLVWLALCRPRTFPAVRSILVLSTGLALLIYLLFPMMPPRLMGPHLHLPGGYRIVDTLAPLFATQNQQAQLGFNPYAAMPSVHFAWALIVGVTVLVSGRRVALRLAGLLYPGLMLAVIVVSGNHLVLDAAGAAVVVAMAALATGVLSWRRAHWQDRTVARRSGPVAPAGRVREHLDHTSRSSSLALSRLPRDKRGRLR